MSERLVIDEKCGDFFINDQFFEHIHLLITVLRLTKCKKELINFFALFLLLRNSFHSTIVLLKNKTFIMPIGHFSGCSLIHL